MFNIIAAIGKNRELGKNNQLVFHLKKDMDFFRKTTLGHSVVMGRNTFESIGSALLDRKNYVVTHNTDGLSQDVIPICDVNAFIEQYLNSDEVFFVIGGASIYKLFLPYASNLYLTEIDAEADADAFFPWFDASKYDRNLLQMNMEDGKKFSIVKYHKYDV